MYPKTRVLIGLIALSLLPLSAANAQRFASQKRGLGAATAFAVSELDHVNLFNGNLVLTLPLRSYPVGPNLSYQATLAFNGNSWDYEEIYCPGPYVQPIPSKNTNAGHGWGLHFGLLIPPETLAQAWRYVSMDGNQHSFYYQLHPGYPATPDATVQYTNDGSYLRMRYSATGTLCESTASPASNQCRLVEFPNGNVAEFRNFSSSGDDYRLTRMRDPFGNFFDLTYTPTTWTLTDSHSRVQTLTFAATTPAYRRLESLSLTSFGGATATYDLQYDENQTIDRQRFNEALCTSSATVAVDLLHRVVLPDGSYYEMDYYKTDDYDPQASQNDVLSGGVKSLRLPTGGKYAWTYTPIALDSQEPEKREPPLPDVQLIVNAAFGVETKSVFENASDATPLGTWSYAYKENLSYMTPNDNRVACHSETTVTDPLGNDTVNYFATSFHDHRWAYALPLTYCNPNNGGYSAAGPYLSMEVYDGDRYSGTRLRSVYVEYGSDGFGGDGADNQEKNHRLRYRKTVYHDDGDKYQDVAFSDFDGMGNFRTRVEGGDFTATQDSRSVYVDYDLGLGELIVDPDGGTVGGTFDLPEPTDTWLFGTYTIQQVTAAGETATTEFCFDSTGFLSLRRVLAGTSRSDEDLLTWFFPGNAATGGLGHVRRELYYGGDNNVTGGGGLAVAGLAPIAFNNNYTDLCDMTLPGQSDAQYRIERTYASGVLKTEKAVDICDAADLLILTDVDVDASTGLVAASRDSAGVKTAFTYDSLGRLTGEQPTEGAWLNYAYVLPTVADGTLVPKLTVANCENGSASCTADAALTWERLLFDGLGRKETERIRIPTTGGIVVQEKTTTYNVLGWKITESVWGDATLKTTYSDYDRFGRVGKIQPPGTNEPTKFTYQGERLKTRESRVRLAGGMASAFTTEYYNSRGKLVLLCEDQASTWSGDCESGELKTTYTYDVGDRLKQVCLNKTGSSCGQTRQFLYDHRGFLTAEQHPEVGPSGNGWTYYEYDSRGNVTTKDVGASTAFDLTYEYDRAGRLTEVWEANNGAPRLLKQYFYGYDNTVTDLRQGKLVQTIRTNWVDAVGPLFAYNPGALKAAIAETFKYEGLGGRVSSRQTRFYFDGLGLAFDLSQTYDPLGNVASITYPQCVHGQGDCPAAAPARTVSYTYEKGFLRSVPGYATQLSYQGGGMLHQIQHANGVTYTVAINPADGLERPYRISTTAGWDTGTYQYDGMGNIHQIGNQEYRYDRLSRLTSGEVAVDGVERTQSVSYDEYGNITSLTTNGSTLTTDTSTSTNRLKLTGLSATYDAGGNLTGITYPNGEQYQYTYDSSNTMKYLQSNQDVARVYLYNADDERVAQFDCPNNSCADANAVYTWTIRDFEDRVIRVYEQPLSEGWRWVEDYVYNGRNTLVSMKTDGAGGERVLYINPDHLGTPRQITASSGTEAELHSYFPFGEEATVPTQDLERMRFTGHERDEGATISSTDDLDYMHARFSSPKIARFLGVDPKDRRRPATESHMWNRYTYTEGNPLKFLDPDGRDIFYANTKDKQFYENAAKRNGRVRRVLDAFRPGSGRDLFVTRGDPGSHKNGTKLAAKTDVTLVSNQAPTAQEQQQMADAWKAAGGGKAGDAAAEAIYQKVSNDVAKATIILGPHPLDHTRLHELGHLEQALNDPKEYARQAEEARNAPTDDAYRESESEIYAEDFAADAKRKSN